MHVIFLDIDGVLNGHNAFSNGYNGMNKSNVQYLNRIIEKVPDVKFVISSAWRYIYLHGDITLKGFEYLFMTHGVNMKGRIMGCTESDEATMDRLNIPLEGERVRREQILHYVGINKVKRFVVLDDLDLDMPNLIQTDGGIGLTTTEANVAIKTLTI